MPFWNFNTGMTTMDMTQAAGQALTQGSGSSSVSASSSGLDINASGSVAAGTKGSWLSNNQGYGTNISSYGTGGVAAPKAASPTSAASPPSAASSLPPGFGSGFGFGSGLAMNPYSGSTGGFGTNLFSQSASQGMAESMAMGNGASAISFGKNGATAQATGTQGTSNSLKWVGNQNTHTNGYGYWHS